MKKKLLLIGNGGLSLINGDYFINEHTANFIKEINDIKGTISYAQFSVKEDSADSLANFNLSQNQKIKIYAFPFNYKNIIIKLIRYIGSAFWLLNILRKYEFIYVFYPGNLSIIALILCNLLGKKYGVYLRGVTNFNVWYNKIIFRNADIILVVSKRFKDELIKFNSHTQHIFPMLKITKQDIIYNRNYNLNNEIILLFVGRIEKDKGIIELITAYRFLSKEFDNLRLNIVGGGPLLEKCKSDVKKLNLNNIHFHGLISSKMELKNIFLESDIFILPSHHEGFPRVLYEAMAYGLPILTTNVGGISSIMRDNENCLFIEPKNYLSITNILKRIIFSEELRASIARGGTKTIDSILSSNLATHSELLINHLSKYE